MQLEEAWDVCVCVRVCLCVGVGQWEGEFRAGMPKNRTPFLHAVCSQTGIKRMWSVFYLFRIGGGGGFRDLPYRWVRLEPIILS